MFRSRSIARKIDIFAGFFAAIMCGLAATVVYNAGNNQASLRSIAGNYDAVSNAIIPLLTVAQDLKLDVTQVQQYLSDVSATRGLDGLDDGFKLADENAIAFRSDIGKARQLAGRLGSAGLIRAIDAAEAAFEPYYRTGKTMAQAYVDEGPSGGNRLMGDFDAAAEKLRSGLSQISEAARQIGDERSAATSGAISHGEASIAFERNAVMLLAGIVLVCALVGALSLRRSLLLPILGLANRMKGLAAGDVQTDVPGLSNRDEIGDMARAVAVFRDSMIERGRLERAADAERMRKDARQSALERIIGEFRAKALDSVRSVDGEIAGMQETASLLTRIAHSTSSDATTTAAAAAQATSSIQTIAAATEELGASVGAIAKQAQHASDTVDEATGVAATTNQKVEGLAGAAEEIGAIVEIINSIAKKTNLLALNATIEAARAGDAGRGFAVVASEVKSLADQTADATSQIVQQVAGIQAASHGAAESIRVITGTMSDINALITGIASAITEQDAATQAIANNINQAAGSSTEVARGVDKVSGAVGDTDHASGRVEKAAQQLAAVVHSLSQNIEAFLADIARDDVDAAKAA
jgi:methyl-accepting chemotaxis protein